MRAVATAEISQGVAGAYRGYIQDGLLLNCERGLALNRGVEVGQPVITMTATAAFDASLLQKIATRNLNLKQIVQAS